MNWIGKEACVQHLAHVEVHRHPRAMYPPHSVHKDNITYRGTFARDFECSSRNVSHHWSPDMIDLDVQRQVATTALLVLPTKSLCVQYHPAKMDPPVTTRTQGQWERCAHDVTTFLARVRHAPDVSISKLEQRGEHK